MTKVIEEVETQYRNFYRHCKTKWNDVWTATCDDECPVCGHDITPYKSTEIK